MMKNIFNKILIIVSFIINTICLVLVLLEKHEANILVIIVFYILLLLPWILKKFKINFSRLIETIYLLFIILACLLGSILLFYIKIHWFDSFVHYISGILTGLLSFIILIKFNKYNEKDLIFNILFMIFTTLAVASLWEIFEFTADNLLDGNAQKVLETGVTDTMKDMICALIGSILVSIMYAYEYCNKKKLIVYKFINRI